MATIDEQKKLTEKIRWLLLLRVVTLTFFLGASALFHFFQVERDVVYLIGLSSSLILAYLISVGSALVLARIRNVRGFAHVQVSFDVLLITAIIWLTGDIASPFSFLYNLAVMNAAILLFYRGAFLTAASSSVCYTALLLWSRYWDHAGMGMPLYWSPLVTVLLNIGSYFVIAWLGGFLADKLGEMEQLLKEKQTDYLELDAFKDALLEGIGGGVAIT